jgi:hypothetical protein
MILKYPKAGPMALEPIGVDFKFIQKISKMQ